MKTSLLVATSLLAASFLASNANAQFSLSPLSSFGGGDGWLSPGEGGYTFLGTGNNERGMAFGNDHLYLVSRNGGNNIRILDKLTGADLGFLNNSGISGGTFAINTAAVGDDGAIYVANLATGPSAFKVYKWTTEGSIPTVAYTGVPLAGGRVGDSMAAIGGGSSTLIAVGFGSAPSVAGNNGYAIIDPTAGTHTQVSFVGTPPLAGDFRLGITFSDSSHVIGTQGSSLYRYTSFSGSSGTLIGSPAIPDPAGASADRLLAYAVVGGKSLLAVQSIGDSHVSIYDVTDPAIPVYLASANNTTAPAANANGTGQLAWGDISGDTAHLWAMSSNQGIQAFTVVVPEPSTVALSILGGAAICFSLIRRRK